MSTNPFRRSSFKAVSTPSSLTQTEIQTPQSSNPSLAINTKVPGSNQKHVNFASPPAVPISPVSFPPSPESTRISPAFHSAYPTGPEPTDYSNALQSDPFLAEAETDENDGAIKEALQNAKVNTDISTIPVDTVKEDDRVRNTLSKFASAPRRAPTMSSPNFSARTSETESRQTMDVDAFKRLLLTGVVNESAAEPESAKPSSVQNSLASENSSIADTTSTSQPSLFGYTTGLSDDTPRTSHEMDNYEVQSLQQSLARSQPADQKKPPPPPKSRHGKSIRDLPSPSNTSFVHESNPLQQPEPSSPHLVAESPTSTHLVKRPPAPPLSRRRSQNRTTSTPAASNDSPAFVETQTAQHEVAPKAPPPPPSRRLGGAIERRHSTDLAPTLEESDASDTNATASRKHSYSKPQPPPTPRRPSNSKRASIGFLSAPPLPPPPRKGRGSSRSSIDSQRPSISTLTGGNHPEVTEDSNDFTGVEDSERKFSVSSNANDILADLAALQREVDAARKQHEY